jgi:hypothetical protein
VMWGSRRVGTCELRHRQRQILVPPRQCGCRDAMASCVLPLIFEMRLFFEPVISRALPPS